MKALTDATPDLITELAARLLTLKESLLAIPVETVQTTKDTGETFESMLIKAPEIVVNQAFEEVVVHRPVVRNSQAINSDRVQLVWNEITQDYDSE